MIAKAGNRPLKDINQAAILAGRERRKDAPHAGNNFLKSMRGFFKWA